jgi:hypothetical protein
MALRLSSCRLLSLSFSSGCDFDCNLEKEAFDPTIGSQEKTYYIIRKLNGRQIKVKSCGAELDETIEVRK